MMKIPIKFKRVVAAFDEATKRPLPCESSGSEYWPESEVEMETNLLDLVNSYIEKGDNNLGDHLNDIQVNDNIKYGMSKNGNYSDANWISGNDDEKDNNDDKERKELLQNLLLQCVENGDGIKQKIHNEIEIVLESIGDCSINFDSRNGLKRSVMAHLRDKGFDAGLCKSRWAKTGRFPAGTYEYIDVKVGPTRYMIEVFLAGQFEIARPTARYTTLLGMIPSIVIIDKAQILRQIMRLMSGAMRKSLKHVGMPVPPWRCNGYLQAKYFSPYKRTTNKSEPGSAGPNQKKKTTIEFGFRFRFETNSLPSVSYHYCRTDDFGSKVDGVRVGLLAAALQGR